jgi:hypothetical protein
VLTSAENSGQSPFVRIEPAEFSFADLKQTQYRDYGLVVAGIGISVIAALLVEFAKTLAVLALDYVQWLTARRR